MISFEEIPAVSSRANASVKLVRALIREKKARAAHGLFAAEGVRLCMEAVGAGILPVLVLGTREVFEKNRELVDFVREKQASLKLIIITNELAAYISDTESPQGIFFVLPRLDKIVKSDTIIHDGHKRMVMLEDLQDPGNIGAIVRSCDAFGIDGVILAGDCADIFSPKALRSTMGSIFRIPVYTGASAEVLAALKQDGFHCYAAMLDESALGLPDVVFPEKCAIVIGNEGAGVTKAAAALCDDRLYIPIKNAQSLNAAAAAAIIIYSLRR